MDITEDVHRELAKQANSQVWRLLDQTGRSQDEDAELLEAAYASLYHWRFAGTEIHRQRGLWLVAHVHTILGDSTQALRYAQACIEWTKANVDSLEDFDVAYAYEGISRAMALAGQSEVAQDYFLAAREAGEEISDPEDRGIFMSDFESGEWYGIS
jgi:tetratricopeptide (TPR) repeat protein